MRLLAFLIPSVVFVVMLTGYINYITSRKFMDIAVQRNARLQVMAVAHEMENLLARCRNDLRFLAQGPLDRAALRDFLIRSRNAGGIDYRQLAFISQNGPDHVFLAVQQGHMVEIPAAQLPTLRPNPLLFFQRIMGRGAGDVWISPITEADFPFPTPANPNQTSNLHLIYFIVPREARHSDQAGFLLAAIDAREIRNLLSLYNSPQSPIWAFARTSELRYFYFFDTEGWILFQSEPQGRPDAELRTDIARSGFTGTLGRPEMPSGFRPASVFGNFWKMVADVREGAHGLIHGEDPHYEVSELKEYSLAYAPVRFPAGDPQSPSVYAGVAYVDRSRLTIAAGYRQIDVMFFITVFTALGVAGIIYGVGWWVTRPILRLAREVHAIQLSGELREIPPGPGGQETCLLRGAINAMIRTLTRQIREIQLRDRAIEAVSLQQKAPMEPALLSNSPITEIVGGGARIEALKSDILKAAQADVDVLIIGETGTGKQLTAEAVHNHSRRSGSPFISINCGELDENLLLDTLFGHVKGAFTEAKADRKGAFLEAHGGTLFLDEIQAASLSVQQALLRAIAMRKIKPLGSDRELDVDVRLIAATNADLSELIALRRFRDDLYFRLKVITIRTPALRDQKEDIPVLAAHFLRQARIVARKEGVSLSKGALRKMLQYHWPGNIRELMNCITRAVVMAEDPIIQADEIHLEGVTEPMGEADLDISALLSGAMAATEIPDTVAAAPSPPKGAGFNPRQEKAYPVILAKGGITRNDYQETVGGGLPPRTALYDLQDLVKKGLLRKVGRGPATQYVPTALDTDTR